MSVMTVLGPIDASELGFTLPHEHIFLDLTNQFREPKETTRRKLANQKVGISNIGILRRNPLALRDNLVIDDYEIAESELLKFKEAGGRTIVDVTSIGLGRDPLALQGLSYRVGINIVAGCAYYYQATHPADMGDKTENDIRDEILLDTQSGINGTNVRAGVIGEVGISEELHPDEEKILAGAARASQETGLGVQIHIFPWNRNGPMPLGLEALKIMLNNGAKAEKVSINHVDVALDINLDYCKRICDAGAYVEFDNFGHEFYVDRAERQFLPGPFATDVQRIIAIKQLVEWGFADHILVSSDVCHKSMLRAYGAWGYDHVLTNIIPMMEDFGLSSDRYKRFLIDNPRRFLDADQ